MKTILFAFSLSVLFLLNSCSNELPADHASSVEKSAYALAIHGGAGTINKEDLSPEKEADIRATLERALDAGEAVLKSGGDALDAVEQAIMVLEDSPHFNAGKGAVFTHDGNNELDASIMDGRDLNAGAVGGLKQVRNPILAARAVMEKSDHVLLTGAGAETFAIEQGIDTVSTDYFFTDFRWQALQRAIEKEKKNPVGWLEEEPTFKYGTVGCVALDKNGNLAAGTSTGGMTNKRYNRFGDVPVIGAGTYANNQSCAVSCTGHGEYFIRYAVAHDISAQMIYGNKTLEEATYHTIHEKLVDAGGNGGLISVDKNGAISLSFNSTGMYRGYAKPGERKVAIYAED